MGFSLKALSPKAIISNVLASPKTAVQSILNPIGGVAVANKQYQQSQSDQQAYNAGSAQSDTANTGANDALKLAMENSYQFPVSNPAPAGTVQNPAVYGTTASTTTTTAPVTSKGDDLTYVYLIIGFLTIGVLVIMYKYKM